MERLKKQDYVIELFTNSLCVPAAGQGALVVIVRAREDHLRKRFESIVDPGSTNELKAEWAFLEHLSLDPSDPVGVLGSIEGKALELEGVLAYPDGREKIHFIVKGALGNEEDLGRTLAEEVLNAGGREILQELHLL